MFLALNHQKGHFVIFAAYMFEDDRTLHIGGHGPGLQFLHANAYTPECYQKFLAPFCAQYEVWAPRQLPLLPKSNPRDFNTWRLFSDDLISYMDSHSLKGVIGMGHSLGAVTTWMAAVQRPDLFSSLILIEPVVIASGMLRIFHFLPTSMKKKVIPPIEKAYKRKNIWNDRAEFREYLNSKRVFQRFDKEVLEDFVQSGVKEKEGQVHLSFPREWEAQIYSHPPNLWSLMPKTPCPSIILKAEFSDVITKKSWEKIKNRTPSATCIEIDQSGHLLPLESPDESAQLILSEMLRK